MADRLYDRGRAGFLSANIDWLVDPVRALLVDLTLYGPDFVNDEFLSDIPALARVATSTLMGGKTATAGVADADDSLFSAVVGAQVGAIVLYQDTGNEATSRLIAYIDTAVGLPYLPVGNDVQVTWSGGADRIFRL